MQCKIGCISIPLGLFVQWTVEHKVVDGFSVFLPNICALFVGLDATFLSFFFFLLELLPDTSAESGFIYCTF